MTARMIPLSESPCASMLPYIKCSSRVHGQVPPFRLRHTMSPTKVSMRGVPDSMLPFTNLEEELLAQQREMAEFQRQMNDQLQREFSDDGFSSKTETKAGYRVETREQRSESGYMYSYSKSVTVLGPGVRGDMPVQGFGIQPAVLALIASYSIVCYLFNKGFEATTFKPAKKLVLALSWPVLAIFNENFRAQLGSAVNAGWKGSNKDRPESPKDDSDT